MLRNIKVFEKETNFPPKFKQNLRMILTYWTFNKQKVNYKYDFGFFNMALIKKKQTRVGKEVHLALLEKIVEKLQ